MRPLQTAPIKLALVVALMNTGCFTDPGPSADWGSDQASLQMTESGANIQFLAPGGCYGSFGVVDHPIPAGTFTLTGTFTQLMGVFPGYVQYPAEYTGTVTGGTMMLSVNVPAGASTLGPFQLTAGVTKSWSACLYP